MTDFPSFYVLFHDKSASRYLQSELGGLLGSRNGLVKLHYCAP